MADVVARNKRPTGKPVPLMPVVDVKGPPPPWVGRVWIGPIRSKYQDKCLICTDVVAVGDIIVFRRPRSTGETSGVFVMCLLCAESIEELDIRPPGR
jgi:hypothetical protein